MLVDLGFKFWIFQQQMIVNELTTLLKESRSNICIEHAMGIMEQEKAPEKLSKKISTMSLDGAGKKVLYKNEKKGG